MESIIEIKGVGKKYNITHQRGGYVTLRDVLVNVLRRPFRFATQKVKRAVGLETKEDFWALRDINLDVKKGEIVGVIGANGAGKSTLLKILTGITLPTEGEIIMRGRVASLLEVGTGFHPELTGRENIFLNGAILGMKGKEIAKKFDEIVAFAGIEKFLDTPVKRYSSGMYVRLAFSVAAHMEPDILLVDEVLAVGDAEFQKKCLGKMEEVTKKDGRTILFVSHNIAAIQALCTRAVLLDQGTIIDSGDTAKVIAAYKEIISSKLTQLGSISIKNRAKRTTGDVLFQEAKGIKHSNECWDFNFDDEIAFEFKATAEKDVEGLLFHMAIRHAVSGEMLSNVQSVISEQKIRAGESVFFSLSIPRKVLRPGRYALYFALANNTASIFYDVIDDNVNIPQLTINTSGTKQYEDGGLFSLPYSVKIHE